MKNSTIIAIVLIFLLITGALFLARKNRMKLRQNYNSSVDVKTQTSPAATQTNVVNTNSAKTNVDSNISEMDSLMNSADANDFSAEGLSGL